MSKQWTEKQLRIAAGQVWDRETGSFREGPADDREKWIEWVIRPYQISVSMCWKIVALQCEINDGWELFSGEAPSDEKADEWGQRRLDWLSRNMPPGIKIQLYNGDADLLMASLNLIQKAAGEILTAIKTPKAKEDEKIETAEPYNLAA